MRTVLLNVSSESDSGQLWEVMSSNEEALSEWEHRTSSSYTGHRSGELGTARKESES